MSSTARSVWFSLVSVAMAVTTSPLCVEHVQLDALLGDARVNRNRTREQSWYDEGGSLQSERAQLVGIMTMGTPFWHAAALSVALLAGTAGAAKKPPAKKVDSAKAAKAIKLSPKEAEKIAAIGQQQFNREEYDQAIGSFQRAYELGREPAMLYNIATSYRRSGKGALAAETYERFLKEEPAGSLLRPRAERNLAEVRLKLEEDRAAQLFAGKQFIEAAAAYDALYKLRREVAYLFQEGVALRLAGRDVDAISALERALPGNLTLVQKDEAEAQLADLRARVADRRARAQLDAGQVLDAVKSWQVAYKYKSDPEHLYRAGQAQRQAGLYQEAIKTFERLQEEAPQSPRRAEVSTALIEVRALMKDRRAAQHISDGKLDKALSAWDEAYEIHSTPLYILKQARALRQAKDKSRALDRYEAYLREPRGEPAERKTEAQLAAAELRELLGAKGEVARLDERLRKPPVHRRGWFIGLMAGAAAIIGAGVTIGVVKGLEARRPPTSDLGDMTVTFSLGR